MYIVFTASCSSGHAAQIPIGNLDTGQRQPVTLQSQTNQPRTLRLTSAPTGGKGFKLILAFTLT